MSFLTSLRRSLLPLGLVACAAGGCGGGGVSTSPSAPLEAQDVGEDLNAIEERALPPVLVTFPGLPTTVEVGELVRFQARASLRGGGPGDLVRISLLNPPVGCAMALGTGSQGVAVAQGRWAVNAASAGPQRLVFRIATPVGLFRRSVDVRVTGAVRSRSRSALQIGDVTGDGVLDTVAVASRAGSAEQGALLVWAGTTTPASTSTALLVDPQAQPGDRLGMTTQHPGVELTFDQHLSLLHLVDVTGDGVLDVVAGAPRSDRGAVDAGAIYVWAGGPGLVGRPAPLVVLQAAVPQAGQMLGSVHDAVASGSDATAEPFVFLNVVGDPARDILVVAAYDDGRGLDAGAIFVWEGGAHLTGAAAGSTLAPTARLLPPVGSEGHALGHGEIPIHAGRFVGDAHTDVVVPGAQEQVYHVFAGGPGMAGDVEATARLDTRLPGVGTVMRPPGESPGVRVLDLDEDGDDELLVNWIEGGGPGPGAILVWRGGPALLGVPAPDHVLRGGSSDDGQGRHGFHVHDVTGDGAPDILAVAGRLPSVTGEIRLWQGKDLVGALPPPAFLRSSGPWLASLGSAYGALVFGDVDGDGQDDVLLCRPEVPAVVQPGDTAIGGEVLVWAGGAGLDLAAGQSATQTAFLRGAALTSPARGTAGRHALQVGDLDMDGVLDVVVGCAVPLNGDPGLGRVECYRGGAGLVGLVPAGRSLTQRLGDDIHVAEVITLADVTGDGGLDLVLNLRTTVSDTKAALAFPGTHAFVLAPGSALRPAALGDFESSAGLLSGDPPIGLAHVRAPLLVGDVTGDGRAELLGVAPYANANGVGSGCVYLWDMTRVGTGSPNPLGLPLHRLRGSATTGHHLGLETLGRQGVIAADVTGDGVLDLLACNPFGSSGEGDIALLRGGPSLPFAFSGASVLLRGQRDVHGIGR